MTRASRSPERGGSGQASLALPATRPSVTPTTATLRLARGRPDRAHLQPGDVLGLQRLAGNRAATSLLQADEGGGPRAAVQRALDGPGSPLPEGLEQRLSSLFETDLSTVRLHDDARAASSAAAVGADAYTAGEHVVLGPQAPAPTTGAGERLLTHELTHVVQQRRGPVAARPAGGGLSVSDPGDPFEREAEAVAAGRARPDLVGGAWAVPTPPSAGGPAPGAPVLQRHASFEHLALGQIPPDQLALVPAARELKLVTRQFTTGLKDAIHLLAQERARLRAWQAKPPTTTGANALQDVDPTWQVQLVKIGDEIATYGEVNTLPDFFGSAAELSDTARKDAETRKAHEDAPWYRQASTWWNQTDTVRRILQTQRESYYQKLGGLLEELTRHDYVLVEEEVESNGSTEKKLIPKYRKETWYLEPGNLDKVSQDEGYTEYWRGRLVGASFAGSQKEFLAEARHPLSHVAKMEGVDVLTEQNPVSAAAGGTWGATARNACHFAPFSWYAWKRYHTEAVAAADEARRLRDEGKAEEADAKENEAWLLNGFGDHYLQDSFAGGHLVNKTLVMQWLLEYVDRQSESWKSRWKYLGPGSASWARMMNMSSEQQPGLGGQDLYFGHDGVATAAQRSSNDPQAASERPDAATSFATLGLQTPGLASGTAAFLTAWFNHQRGKDGFLTAEQLVTRSGSWNLGDQPLDVSTVEGYVGELEERGWIEEHKTTVDDKEVPAYRISNARALQSLGQRGQSSTDAAKTLTFENYHEFMNDAFIQSGAGALHDYFCKEGVVVGSVDSPTVFRIYGDDNMLSAGAQEGVAYSARTAAMSREAIALRLRPEGGRQPASVEDIFRRVPTYAALPERFGGEAVPETMLRLDEWHDELKPFLGEVFEQYGHYVAARVPYFGKRGGLTALGKVSAHSGAIF